MPPAWHRPPRYRFGVFDFDADTLELRRRGRLVKVRPQPLKLLALTLRNPGELVSRDEIRRCLWDEHTFVDVDQGVNSCVRQLRDALQDDAESPRFVETLPRRGYRFIAPVTVLDGGVEPKAAPLVAAGASPTAPIVEDREPLRQPASARHTPRGYAVAAALAIAIAVVALQLAARSSAGADVEWRSLVVHPFTADDPAVGRGLAHEIARRLGGLPSLQAARVRVRAGPEDGSPRAPADPRQLVLSGDMRTRGAERALQARLASAAGGDIIWSQQIVLKAEELFSVEDVIAERVVSALRLTLAAPAQERLRRRYTQNAPAYEGYLRGRAALAAYTPEGTRAAVAAFEAALAADPGFTLARAGLAAAAADMYLRFAPAGDPDGWAERAEEQARAALELDPDLAEAHLARAAVARKREFDWETTIVESRRALALNPTLDQAHFFIAAAYYHLGYMEEALIEMERGRQLGGPDQVEPRRIEALVALFSGRFAPAVAHLEEVSRRSSGPIGDTYLALAYFYSGSEERATRLLQTLAEHPSASTSSRAGAALAAVLANAGRRAEAIAAMQSVESREYRDHHVTYLLGAAAAQLGDEADAARLIRAAVDSGFPCPIWLERDPLLSPVRSRSLFEPLLRHAREQREASAAR